MNNYKKLIKNINLLSKNESYIFREKNFKDALKPLKLSNLIIKKGFRSIELSSGGALPFELSHTIPRLDFFTFKEVYEELSIYLLHYIFSEKNYGEIEIAHPKSEIKKIYLYTNKQEDLFYGLKESKKIISYEYFFPELNKLPLALNFGDERGSTKSNSNDGLSFNITSHKNELNKEEVVVINSIGLGHLSTLVSLWLDMSREDNLENEICLENPILGSGGVNLLSAEVSFWLPNSFRFPSENLNSIL